MPEKDNKETQEPTKEENEETPTEESEESETKVEKSTHYENMVDDALRGTMDTDNEND